MTITRMARPTGIFDPETFQGGDLVTRDGTDVQRVIYVNEDGTAIEVECVKAPSSGWCKVGEREYNMARRYDFASDVIDGEAAAVAEEACLDSAPTPT